MSFLDKLLKKSNFNNVKIDINAENKCIYSPVDGKLVYLEELNDGMFSEKIMGDGIAIIPSDGVFFSPVNGTMESVFPTGHAYAIKTDKDVEVLIHIGIDTVSLKGEGFKSFVKQGQKVEVGEKIAEVNLEFIKKSGCPIETMIIITSGEECRKLFDSGSFVKSGSKIIEL